MVFLNISDILIDFALDLVFDFMFEMVQLELRKRHYILLDMFCFDSKDLTTMQEPVETLCETLFVTAILIAKEVVGSSSINVYVATYYVVCILLVRSLLLSVESIFQVLNNIFEYSVNKYIKSTTFGSSGYITGYYIMDKLVHIDDLGFMV